MPSMDEMFALRSNSDVVRQQKADRHQNKLLAPMHRAYGRGPDGKTCGECVHLVRVRLAKTYIKCALGPNSRGPGTDWRSGWMACGKWEAR